MKNISYDTFKFMDRTIRVMIAKDNDYEQNLPLLIMQDGQNLFFDEDASFKRSWNFERVWYKHNLPSLIIVGIDCLNGEDRLDEFSPFINKELYKNKLVDWVTRPVGGGAKEYANFLVNHLLPLIKEKYPCSKLKKDIAIGGSSMGGLFSLFVLIKYSKYFANAICVSPSFWFNFEELKKFLDKAKVGHIRKLYIDIGSKEYYEKEEPLNDINRTKEVVDILVQKGLVDNILYQQIGGASHNEASWEKRIATFIEYVFE